MNYPSDNNDPPPRRRHPLEVGRDEQVTYHQPGEGQKPKQPVERMTINMKQQTPIITFALIGINLLVFIFGIGTNSTQELWALGAINGGWVFNDGEYYRLLTAMFLHGNAAHIFFNMYALYILGMSIEQMYGRWRFMAIYFLGGLTGSVASAALNLTGPTDFGVGASGAVFALLGAQILYFWRFREELGSYAQNALRQYMGLLAINVVLGLAAPNIDNTAHMGGLIGGAVLGFLLAPTLQVRRLYDYLGNPMRVIDVKQNKGGEAITAVYGLSLIGLTTVAGFLLF
jgi:rhomboid protease GluP